MIITNDIYDEETIKEKINNSDEWLISATCSLFYHSNGHFYGKNLCNFVYDLVCSDIGYNEIISFITEPDINTECVLHKSNWIYILESNIDNLLKIANKG